MENFKQNIILNPILTEKSSLAMEQFNKYIFNVNVNANKLQIKEELEKRFKIQIIKISTMNYKGKSKNTTIRSGGHVLRTSGKRKKWKKAIISVKEGQKIDLVEGDFNS